MLPDFTKIGLAYFSRNHKGAITSEIKHAIKLKASPASLAGFVKPPGTGGLLFCS